MAETGFQRPSLHDLIDRAQNDVNANIDGADAKLRRSVLSVLSSVISGQTHGLYGFQGYISRQSIVDTADKENLALWAKVWDIDRKPATKATGEATFEGTDGSIITVGTECRRGDGVVYVVDNSATVVSGIASTKITAQTVGVDGNTNAGVQVSLLTAVPGISSSGIIAAAGLTAGADEEGDESLRVRVLDRIQEPPHGGALFDYEKWALEVPGVTRAWPSATEMGIGTVTVRFMMDNTYPDGVPLAADVLTLQAYIDERRPITADVYVVAPIATAINITVQDLSPDTPEIRQAVLAELDDFLRREAEPGKSLPLSKFWEAVAIATGEFSHKIVLPTDDVTMNTGEIAILGTVTFTTGGV